MDVEIDVECHKLLNCQIVTLLEDEGNAERNKEIFQSLENEKENRVSYLNKVKMLRQRLHTIIGGTCFQKFYTCVYLSFRPFKYFLWYI